MEISPKNVKMWSRLGPSGAVGAAAMELAERLDDIAILTADLCFFSGLERVKAKYPDKFYNLGIAEQNMIGVAGGMAKEGLIPYVTTYASFATTRCLDQVRVNMAYMKFPIKLIGLTAGFGAGILGATHMSIEDVAVMRALPNITIVSPADCTEIIKCMMAVARTDNPTYIRLTGPINTPIVYQEDYCFEIGKAITLHEGEDVCIIATGSMVAEALEASRILLEHGIAAAVVNMHTIKPLDTEKLKYIQGNYKLIVTLEEHSVIGGLGGAVCEYIAQNRNHVSVLTIGINDFFAYAGDYRYQLEQCGLTAPQIASRILQSLSILHQ